MQSMLNTRENYGLTSSGGTHYVTEAANGDSGAGCVVQPNNVSRLAEARMIAMKGEKYDVSLCCDHGNLAVRLDGLLRFCRCTKWREPI